MDKELINYDEWLKDSLFPAVIGDTLYADSLTTAEIEQLAKDRGLDVATAAKVYLSGIDPAALDEHQSGDCDCDECRRDRGR